jgi:predicted transcriptional regulator
MAATPYATSLKLARSLKARVSVAAEAAGTTPHAFMVEAIERETTRAELYETFLTEAVDAERDVQRTGTAYAAADVFTYMTARAKGKPARRPRPKAWRR